MNKAVAFLKNLINALVLHGAICLIGFYSLTIYTAILYFPLCLLAAFVGKLIAKNIKSNLYSFLLCIVLFLCFAASGFIFGHPVIFLLFAVVVFGWLMFYRYGKRAQRTDFAHQSFVLVFIFLFIVGYAFEINLLCTIACIDAFLFLVINIFLNGVFSHEKFIEENKNVKNIPTKQIRKTYMPLLAVFSSICFAAMLLWRVISMPVDFLSKHILNFISQIIRLLPRPEIKQTTVVDDVGQAPLNEYDMALYDFGVEVKQNYILEQIGTILAITSLILVAVILVFLLIRKFTQTLAKSKNFNGDEVEFLFSKDKITSKRKSKADIFESSDINKKIRRIYKKRAQKSAKNILNSDTPYIISKKANMSETLQSLYEKARYSKSGCSKHDLDQVKKEIKG